ncbi:hypothetical protein [Sulfurimonas sp.]|jgi:hypothetical protein|uniref:hypothetical protein n=1 Tax=Sulfurimonas sp. TaxID=2022749 RepID=UPI002A368467|nr:hypothetical protein [Sulfurimonas sp.]MDY0122845.1 hypothetical protein [Sulfurimonas sp.]
MKEVDWDAPDDVIDFEDLEEVATLPDDQNFVKSAAKKVHTEPPPPKKTVELMNEKQEKIIMSAAKQAQKLSKELETLDFQIEKFNKFERKVSSFKVKNTIAIGAVALFLGGYIGSLAQSELNNYYINQELKGRVGAAAAELELLQKAKNRGVVFAIDADRVVVWSPSKNDAVTVSQNDQYKIFEISLKNTKK